MPVLSMAGTIFQVAVTGEETDWRGVLLTALSAVVLDILPVNALWVMVGDVSHRSLALAEVDMEIVSGWTLMMIASVGDVLETGIIWILEIVGTGAMTVIPVIDTVTGMHLLMKAMQVIDMPIGSFKMSMAEEEVISEMEDQDLVVTVMEVEGQIVLTGEATEVGPVLMTVIGGETIYHHTIGTEAGRLFLY